MSDCELLQTCIFFNDRMANMPSTAEIIKQQYCKGDNSNCARYMVFSSVGRDKVTPDLFPNNTDRAMQIIAGN
jgi:hypothetical protein